MELGGVGVWSGELRTGDPGAVAEAAAELEGLGYSALWIPGRNDAGVLDAARALLDATSRVVVATGILNLWRFEPADVIAGHAALTGAHPGRFLLGVGVGHKRMVDAEGPPRYRQPLQATARYLEALDGGKPPVRRDERVLAALGDKMLRLAAEQAAGAHPYFVPPEHTHRAREVLGPEPLLAPEQAVALETDPRRAREIAREHMAIYLSLPNYVNNLRRLGFAEEDFADGGSDRLADAIVAWGDVEQIAARVREHFAAGANHVTLQVTPREEGSFPWQAWRSLAEALGEMART